MAIAKKYQAFRYKTQGSGKNKYIKIINFDNSAVTPIVPAYINDIPVKAIDDYAFHETTIESITMPDTLEEIGEYAFAGCHRLKNISFPDSVKNIGDMVCSACYSLEFVKWSNTAEYIQPHTFYNCKNLKEISNMDNVKEIRKMSFACSGLETFTAPEKCVFIKNNAFSQCESLNYIRIPISVKSIDDNVFEGSKNVKLDSQRNSRVREWAESQGIPIIDSKLNSFLKNINEDIETIK